MFQIHDISPFVSRIDADNCTISRNAATSSKITDNSLDDTSDTRIRFGFLIKKCLEVKLRFVESNEMR